MFSVEWEGTPAVTLVPDSFIMKYLPGAPGEYIKVYLFLLMLSHRNDAAPSFDIIGDTLSQTRDEVAAALKYWERYKLLDVFYKNDEITGIRLRLSTEAEKSSHRLSGAKVKQLLSENEDAKTLVFVAEQYMGKPLSSVETGTLLYFLDTLKFPLDLCEYLVEYCLERGKKSIRYMEKVGLGWHKKGFRTLEDAKADTAAVNYFAVLKAFGISGRDPISPEKNYIDKWIGEYGFSLEMVTDAAQKAVMKKAGFKYADRILERWREAGIKTPDEARQAEQLFKQQQAAFSDSSSETKSKNSFHNFKQRDIDFDELEKQLDNQLFDNDTFN